ncbi:MAG: sigma-70 family RNA polymerase sigma factor [Dysosmobacter sp.]|nr:sigma-70 family RNA polymerase sigma factor [Dysosmobacter sp.]
MEIIHFNTCAGDWIGDVTDWEQQGPADNGERLDRLRRSLRSARVQELTSRQRQVLRLYYDQEKTLSQIAEELGVNRSTVSRTLCRARKRLYRCLRYAL